MSDSQKEKYFVNATSFHIYTPYGYLKNDLSHQQSLGFNGELLESHSGTYMLGNGYRPFSPVCMRFLAPDNWSPFGDGGLNAFGYCTGDPINNVDPDGHTVINKLRRQPVVLTPDGPPLQTAQHLNRALNRQRLPRDYNPNGGPLTQPPPTQQPPANRNPLATGNRMPFQDRRRPGLPLQEVVIRANTLIKSQRHLADAEKNLGYIHDPEMRSDYQLSLARIRRAVPKQQAELSRDMVRWFHS
ncbi:RHS repeat-associated core domain-containing protein [Pseudomonas sp. WOUb67]|uniref:RHS repeat-associated core domain-containing protein n=1 Tax=Pseudomonas sp. WOUb67 TaxID=3161136 RepID=UPI003CFAD7D9